MNIIETQNLTKIYGDFTAVSNLNLHIRKGTSMAFSDLMELENPQP